MFRSESESKSSLKTLESEYILNFSVFFSSITNHSFKIDEVHHILNSYSFNPEISSHASYQKHGRMNKQKPIKSLEAARHASVGSAESLWLFLNGSCQLREHTERDVNLLR